MTSEKYMVRADRISHLILTVRGQRVMLDADLARIYGVATKRLNEQLKRNLDRFPEDFAFQLTPQEVAFLKSQFATSNQAIRSQFATASKRNIRYLPWVFTEHGAIMLASVLNSPVAVEASVRVVRAFVFMREQLARAGRFDWAEVMRRLAELEGRVGQHDEAIRLIFIALKQLLEPPPAEEEPKRQIGFQVKESRARYTVRPRRTRY